MLTIFLFSKCSIAASDYTNIASIIKKFEKQQQVLQQHREINCNAEKKAISQTTPKYNLLNTLIITLNVKYNLV